MTVMFFAMNGHVCDPPVVCANAADAFKAEKEDFLNNPASKIYRDAWCQAMTEELAKGYLPPRAV